MPILRPDGTENEQEFISRCMGNDSMNKEFPDQEQRAGVCYSQWRKSDKCKKEIAKNAKEAKEVAKTLIQGMGINLGKNSY